VNFITRYVFLPSAGVNSGLASGNPDLFARVGLERFPGVCTSIYFTYRVCKTTKPVGHLSFGISYGLSELHIMFVLETILGVISIHLWAMGIVLQIHRALRGQSMCLQLAN
jgi:hypothetical protein